MNRLSLNKRQFLGLMAAAPLGTLVGCGGGSDSNQAKVRLVNASAGYDLLDLYADDDQILSSVAFGQVSGYTGIDEGSIELSMTVADSGTYLLSQTRSLSAGTHYTLIAYGWEGALKGAIASDDLDAADSGKAKVSVLNTTPDSSVSLDVYLTAESDLIEAATPIASSVAGGGAQSSYSTTKSGTYRLRVTLADDTSDLRLDVSGVVLASKGLTTLVLVQGAGGVLVHAIQVEQGSTVTHWPNTQARVRVVAGVADGSRVSVSAGDTEVISGAPSPTVGAYQLVNAGAVDLVATAGSSTLATVSTTLEPGEDVTLLVHGASAATAALAVLSDDNRLPTTSTKAKLRLVNAMAGLDDYPLTLRLAYSAVASSIAQGAASAYKQVASTTSSTLDVASSASSTALFTQAETALSALGVYTVFMFGTGASAVGTLYQER